MPFPVPLCQQVFPQPFYSCRNGSSSVVCRVNLTFARSHSQHGSLRSRSRTEAILIGTSGTRALPGFGPKDESPAALEFVPSRFVCANFVVLKSADPDFGYSPAGRLFDSFPLVSRSGRHYATWPVLTYGDGFGMWPNREALKIAVIRHSAREVWLQCRVR